MKKESGAKGSKLLRKGRVSWSLALYWISAFKAEGAQTFDNQLCFQAILEQADQLEREGSLYCLAIVLMPDHLHMVARLGAEANLSKTMKRFKGASAFRINQLRGTKGSVWYEGFHDHLLRPDQPPANFVKYLLQKPVKAGLVKNPFDWPYLKVKNFLLKDL